MSNNVISASYSEAVEQTQPRVNETSDSELSATLGYDVNPFQGNFCPKNASQRWPKRLMFPTLFLSCDAALAAKARWLRWYGRGARFAL
jgi:hypothetical protein